MGSQSHEHYSELALEHFRNPRNVGEIKDAGGVACKEHPACGDRLKIWVRLDQDENVEVKFRASACVGTVAAASAATTMAEGIPAADVLVKVTEQSLSDLFGGFPPGKSHCPKLVATVLHDAVSAARKAQGKDSR